MSKKELYMNGKHLGSRSILGHEEAHFSHPLNFEAFPQVLFPAHWRWSTGECRICQLTLTPLTLHSSLQSYSSFYIPSSPNLFYIWFTRRSLQAECLCKSPWWQSILWSPRWHLQITYNLSSSFCLSEPSTDCYQPKPCIITQIYAFLGIKRERIK